MYRTVIANLVRQYIHSLQATARRKELEQEHDHVKD